MILNACGVRRVHGVQMSSLVDDWSASLSQLQSTMLEERVENKFNNAVAGNIEVLACPSTKDRK